MRLLIILTILLIPSCTSEVQPEWEKYDTGYGIIWIGTPEMVNAECHRRGAVTDSDGCFDTLVREMIIPSLSKTESHRVKVAIHEACHMYLSAGHEKCPVYFTRVN